MLYHCVSVRRHPGSGCITPGWTGCVGAMGRGHNAVTEARGFYDAHRRPAPHHEAWPEQCSRPAVFKRDRAYGAEGGAEHR